MNVRTTDNHHLTARDSKDKAVQYRQLISWGEEVSTFLLFLRQLLFCRPKNHLVEEHPGTIFMYIYKIDTLKKKYVLFRFSKEFEYF